MRKEKFRIEEPKNQDEAADLAEEKKQDLLEEREGTITASTLES